MIGRRWAAPKHPLGLGEGFVQHRAAWRNCVPQRRKQVALQVPADDHELEPFVRQRIRGQIRAPSTDNQPSRVGASYCVADRLELQVDAEHAITSLDERDRVSSPAHGEIQRAPARGHGGHKSRRPIDDELRRRISISHTSVDLELHLAQALLTGIGIGITGLVVTAVFGVAGADLTRHISYGIFSTMVTLLAHSMMMFYLIGKGKAVKDAMAEGGLQGDYYRRIAAARKPVFSIGTFAMGVTMVAAIMGASVDTGVLPPIVHGMIAYGAVACNLAAVKIEIDAIGESSRVVDEVNRLLGS